MVNGQWSMIIGARAEPLDRMTAEAEAGTQGLVSRVSNWPWNLGGFVTSSLRYHNIWDVEAQGGNGNYILGNGYSHSAGVLGFQLFGAFVLFFPSFFSF